MIDAIKKQIDKIDKMLKSHLTSNQRHDLNVQRKAYAELLKGVK